MSYTNVTARDRTARQNVARPRRRRRWRIVLRVFGGLVALLVVAEGIGLVLELREARIYPKYWSDRAAEPVRPGAVRLVAFGDSAALGIGAWRPQDSVVGRIASYVGQRTGRPVHVANMTTGGGTVGTVLTKQLPTADVAHADVVVVIAGSNDVGAKAPLDTFRSHLEALIAALPPDRTVLSDIPLQSGRDPYQKILAEVADARGVAHADFAGAFNRARRLDVFAPDFQHVNSTGYRIWFDAFRPALDRIVAKP
jgi:lysophospholipase L1-like esterase